MTTPDDTVRRILRPRCFLLRALAPEGDSAAEANRTFNELLADPSLPLPVFHDHFIGRPGGVAILFAETEAERNRLLEAPRLTGWEIEIHPLIFSASPAAFDEQIAFTLRAYRGFDWDALRVERRPTYGDTAREAETAMEDGADPDREDLAEEP